MAQPLSIPPPGFDKLSIEEKIEYVNLLWDHILSKPEEIPVPEWHRPILDERLARDKESPGEAIPWEDVKDETAYLFRSPANREQLLRTLGTLAPGENEPD